ncbi:ParB/RepB/Spo0J family partition protein [Hoeflea prorocentri]|uniref:ParB/RepB/Spo0J family partition protein n=1 Tax=Hoeflea prorocentri TaxID=1922333 RepID=A0A9X3UKX9_9HYPH|nr:ParB/RepB/Spo0J family partition protein [Hoeflea prorocentri]MCY6383178.1 ParB/RepB/Spo0J family partition protein [Hoeflea prorocentri]MDA5400978.1 ParB/RepB/Spo0J family partition protein [Hoeflea prorocentri]
MSDENSKKRLGRGLAALIGEMDQPYEAQETPVAETADQFVPIEFVSRNPNNPRRNFDESDLEDLARSINQHGIVQPVVVRPMGDGRYEIIAGERRWRAAQRAGLVEIPVLIRDVDDRMALEIAIVENVQRSDLNPLDEALGYEQLIADHGYTQNDLGDIIGKSRSHVANSLRLLKLPEKVRDMLSDGALTAGHARAIASTSDPVKLARQIVSKGMSVRDAERLAQKDGEPATSRSKSTAPAKDADTLALEKMLTDNLGLKVTISHRGGGGQVKVDYRTLEQLDELCRLLQAQR